MLIGILIADNPYGTTRTFGQELGSALEEAGHQCKTYYLHPDTFSDSLSQLFEDSPDYTCSFSDIRVGGGPFSEYSPWPHVTMLLDPAIYFLHHVKAPNSIVTCVDEGDVDWLRQMGYSNVHFIPHLISKSHFTTPLEQEEHCYDAVFFGTCIDFERVLLSWGGKYPSSLSRCLERAAFKVLEGGSQPILKVLLESLEEGGVDPYSQDLSLLHHEVDLYVRGRDRAELIAACSQQCRVDIWGDGLEGRGWERFSSDSTTIHPPIHFEQTLKILQKSRFLLNSTIRFHKSCHERLLYGLAYGALPITTNNPLITRFFPSNGLVTYQPSQWKNLKIPSKIPPLDQARSEALKLTWEGFISFFNHLNQLN